MSQPFTKKNDNSTAQDEMPRRDLQGSLPAVGIRILLADTDSTTIRQLEQLFQQQEQEYSVTVTNNGMTALDLTQKKDFDVVLADIMLPRLTGLQLLTRLRARADSPEVILMSSDAGIDTAVEAMHQGAADFLSKPLGLQQVLEKIQRACERGLRRCPRTPLTQNLNRPRQIILSEPRSPKMKEISLLVSRVAKSNSTILITGDSGVGKEVVARTIHRESLRCNNTFTDISCAAIPETLLESELFGYEKGSFTGADSSKPGLFEVANGGTLFLDEIGEIGPVLQTKLLRVIETRSFFRVGGTKQISVDVRILAATNKDLKIAVEEGKFRKDLFYRLNTINIEVPSLKEHPGDIPELIDQFIAEYDRTGQRRFSEAALGVLQRYGWPGNIRELKNVVERVLLISPQMLIDVEDLPEDVLKGKSPADEKGKDVVSVTPTLVEMEKRQIAEVLHKTRWHRGKAAELLAISPKTLYRKIKQYDLDRSLGIY